MGRPKYEALGWLYDEFIGTDPEKVASYQAALEADALLGEHPELESIDAESNVERLVKIKMALGSKITNDST